MVTGAKSEAANPLNDPIAPTRMVFAVTPSVSPAWDTVSTVTLAHDASTVAHPTARASTAPVLRARAFTRDAR